MSNWKLINQTIIYDGTFNGLLNIVFQCYSNKFLPQKIYDEKTYSPNFLDKTMYIDTDYTKSERVFSGINNNIGYEVLYNSFYAFLSDEKEKEMNILKYICEGFDIGPKINTMITVSYVYKVISMRRKALSECHKLKGLLRFIEVGENIFYAQVHPDNNIIEPLGQHFIKRLPSQNFIIHDKNRNLYFLYNGKDYTIVENQDIHIPEVTLEEQKYQDLWKIFFKTIAIKERKNPRCQMQFMPKKYWKDLIENPYDV